MFLLFDIGGTNTRIAISFDKKTIETPVVVSTPHDFNEGMRIISKTAKELISNKKVSAICCGIAGPLNKEKNVLVGAPHLSGWIGQPIMEKLEQIFSSTVFIENDTALAGLGEAVHGAGRGYGIVAYITASTGIGGARIIDGKIDRNAFGFEIGHQIIQYKDNNATTLEKLAGGAALEQKYGKKPEHIKDKEIWDNEMRLIAYGLNNTIVYWSPDIIILGGGMVRKSAISIEHVEGHLRDIQNIFPVYPSIVRAELENLAGLYGALAYIRQHEI